MDDLHASLEGTVFEHRTKITNMINGAEYIVYDD
jgi:hypothetical protein